ncbi:protein INSYN2B isoform X2 [Chiroxiphia lanceolata]|uniref:protein INSYN2B isoform X2 n=1 Tax=Chiroxiphia lanceolata TaxID=296741 RepID=UPI0013CE989B|nr:protein INSYN2B isoform X2 [Chiroxiphia lanceolata]
MTNEMGRKETRYLQTLNCDSMAQQNMKMRPVLLKRNSLDSADFLRPPQHRRTKSQQVRFKEDGVSTKAELEAHPTRDAPFPTGKPEIFRDHDFFLTRSPTFPTRAQKGLRNIAIQTSPSLRKHCPVFKKKKLTGSKSLTEMPTEPAHPIQVNGSLCEQDIVSADLCYLRITNHGEDGCRNGEGDGQLSQRAPKAQSNGPIYSEDSSVSEKTTASTQVPEYIHVSFPQDRNVSMDAPDTATDPSHSSTVTQGTESSENSTLSSEPERAEPCLSNSANCRECDPHSAAWGVGKSDSELPVASRDGSSKETAPLSPPSNHSSSPCSLRDCHQAGEHKADPSCVMLPGDHTTSSDPPKPAPLWEPGMEESSTQADAAQWNSCSGGSHTKSCPPRNEIKPQSNQEMSEVNQIHLAHGELCALQGRLQSVEESLQSNQEKIKVLLNVIQDLEKSRALSEGRNFYHTGQDLNNCSTCQNTACIIYRI